MRLVVLGGLVFAAFVGGAGLTLAVAGGHVAPFGTSWGYTWSLGIWLLPDLVLIPWALRATQPVVKRSLVLSLAWLVPMGFVLDLLFAHSFFEFPDRTAVSGIPLPSLGGDVPIEEYVFYLGGFVAIQLLYSWLDEELLAEYNVSDYEATWKETTRQRLLVKGRAIPAIGVAIAAVAWIALDIHWLGDQGGPHYLGYLLFVGLTPNVLLLPAVWRFVNWRACAMTLLVVLGVSVLWEVSLALPLEWWDYNHAFMSGPRVPVWSDLPLEAILVWFAACMTVVSIYEAVKVWQFAAAPVIGSPDSRAESFVRRLAVQPRSGPR